VYVWRERRRKIIDTPNRKKTEGTHPNCWKNEGPDPGPKRERKSRFLGLKNEGLAPLDHTHPGGGGECVSDYGLKKSTRIVGMKEDIKLEGGKLIGAGKDAKVEN